MSFGWNCMFRKGQWLEFRRFVLLQRQNVGYRINYINKEISHIGEIRISYEKVGEGEDQRVTEKRVGLEVGVNSVLGKLLKAYIAQGGNPFDISMFLKPDSYQWVEREVEASSEQGTVTDSQGNTQNVYKSYDLPYGGTLWPRTATAEESEQVDTSGWLPLLKYPGWRLGGSNKSIYPRADEIGGVIYHARKWATQEISHLRNNLEARIIKLCDLREQLLIERDDLLFNALSGTASKLAPYDPNIQLDEVHLSHIVTNIDLNYFEAMDQEQIDQIEGPPAPNTVDRVASSVPDFSKLRDRGPEPYYKSLLDDYENGEEDNTAL
jgi:hypothetical protein